MIEGRAGKMMTLRLTVLKYVSEQRYATLEDIYNGSGNKAGRESFRVSLYQFGLSRFSFPGVKEGIWHIGKQDIFKELQDLFPNDPLYSCIDIHPNEVLHALGMNKIRYFLANQAGITIERWQSEYSLRSLPLSMREFEFRNIPDAIFWRKLEDGSVQKCFVEYERSLKIHERYKNILKAYARRSDVTEGSILFICQSESIQKELLRARKAVFDKGIFNEQQEYFRFMDYARTLHAIAD